MNTKNNKRRQLSKEKIETVFIELLQTKDINEITVSEIIKRAELNRTTFYANYLDIYDLADKLRDNLEKQVEGLYEKEDEGKYYADNWLKLFTHIKNNSIFYKTYFKLGYDSKHTVNIGDLNAKYQIFPEGQMSYHIEFFKAGFNAIVKKWLEEGCKESPETMSQILKDEYSARKMV